MSNPLFNQFGVQQNSLAKQFNEFKNNFSGDPRQQVQNLLNSGRMTQEQFNRLSKMASQFQNFLR